MSPQEIQSLIENSGVNKLLVCSYLKISLALLDDFLTGRILMPDDKIQLLIRCVEDYQKYLKMQEKRP